MMAFNSLRAFAVFWLFAHSSMAQQNHSKVYKVSGTIFSTRDYCGGAAPTEEMLKQLRMPVPLSGKKIFFKCGETNMKNCKPVKSITTDSLGHFYLQLPAGTYCVVEEYKTKALKIPADNENSKWDADCLLEEYSKCDYQFTVGDHDVADIAVTYTTHCSWNIPCQFYNGPLPPSAPRGK